MVVQMEETFVEKMVEKEMTRKEDQVMVMQEEKRKRGSLARIARTIRSLLRRVLLCGGRKIVPYGRRSASGNATRCGDHRLRSPAGQKPPLATAHSASPADDFSMLAQVDTEPYDIFGCWLGRDTFMSGFINHHDMFCLHVHGTGEVDTGGNVHANQNQQGHRLFKFACSNGSYPRMLMVATPGEGQPKPPPPSGGPAASAAKGPSASSGRPSWLLGGSLLRRDHYTSKAAAAAAVVRRRKHQHAMSNERRLPPRERFLVYGTGDLTYASHQIGVKQIPTQPHEYVKRVDGHHAPDHMLELHGQIIGMALSPDHRFLYVNCRAWPAGCVVTEPTEPPAISRDIDTRELELPTLRPTGRSFRGHHAFTAEHNCFFIFLNSSEDFLASGAEDHHGYVWERHYAALLGRLPHSDVVNCVAFNPADQEMLISASDDRNIKVWRSRRAMRRLRLQQQQELAVQS
ncbi:F-box/WD repeat-containing protein 5-like [Lethenteron reissneri]|uniref:F-box/WD repeat-containing protein 5-like n=1 Tax=Lethenteron reissneri TaxID=7753 RepID=UPI002AB7BF90|nr:F-box/WD repeat-containing protein 5-like [Lethenteron reissneri]